MHFRECYLPCGRWQLRRRRRARPGLADRCSGKSRVPIRVVGPSSETFPPPPPTSGAAGAWGASPLPPLLTPHPGSLAQGPPEWEAISWARCSRRPHGRQLAQMLSGGLPARHIWPAPGRPRRQRPLRCIVAAPGARLCPNFRGRQCSSLSCCSSWGGTGRATGRVCDLPGYCRMWFDFCGLGRFSPPAHCSAGWWEPRFHTADALALFMLSCPHRHGWGSYLAHVRLEYIDATLAT